jgi:hypothetical protein
MSVITFAADSTSLILNGQAITDFVAGDIITLAPANPATAHINGTNGGVNINERSDKAVYDLTIRAQRFTPSDVFLNNALRQSPPVVFSGSVKEDYTRDGTAGVESWLLENGSFTTQPTSTKNDQDGNALMEYVIHFRTASRNL